MSVAGVYQIRDFVPQLNYASENAAKALRGMLDMGLDIHDYNVQKKQRGLIDDANALRQSIEEDRKMLEQLKAQLANLQGGK